MNARMMVRFSLAFCASCIVSEIQSVHGSSVLVTSPFVNAYTDWLDPAPARNGDWRINLAGSTMMETSNVIPGGNNPAGATNNGSFVPTLMIQNNYVTPSTYELSSRMYSSDDDGFGLVFGYQDLDNYYRVLLRAQLNGNLGGTHGLSVQKVVGGFVTQISPNGTGVGFTWDPDMLNTINAHDPFDVRVVVNDTNYAVYVAGVNNDLPLQSGNDAGLAAGKIGILSWAQRQDANNGLLATNPIWGTEVETISVSDNSGVLYSGTFTGPVKWRELAMKNTNNLRTNATTTGDDRGDFGLNFQSGWVYQRTNGFEWATNTAAANIDFLGPAVVVDEPGSHNYQNYELKVRMGAVDDDGIGVIVRAQDDDNFYRIMITPQPMLPANTPANIWERAPEGLSVQKVRNGVWSELFRDDPDPLVNNDQVYFSYANGAGNPSTTLPMFDLSVKAVGNTLTIQVIDRFGNVYDYPVIVDDDDPILRGTAGLTTWGNEHSYFMGYGGDINSPFLIRIPEPSTIALSLLAGLGLIGWVRRQK